MIDLSLHIYGADKIGSYDFVLENAGGAVMLDYCSKSYTDAIASITLFGFNLWHFLSNPKVIIQVSLGNKIRGGKG